MYFHAFQVQVRDSKGHVRFLQPSEVVALGRDVIAGGVFTGIPVGSERTPRLRKCINEAHRIAQRHGLRIRFFVAIRPDHYAEVRGAGRVAGFRDRWVLRTARDQYRADLDRFRAARWRVEPAAFLDPRFIARIMDEEKDEAPCFYGRGEHATQRFVINGVLADLRDPAYRRWQIAWAQRLATYLDADGFAIGIKTGWLAQPMYRRPASPHWGNSGGPLSPTPYGPGEFEDAMSRYIQELSQLGLPIVVRDSTPGRGGPGAWFPPEMRRVVEGEFVPLPLPGQVRSVPR